MEGHQMVIRKSLAGLAAASMILGSAAVAAAPVANHIRVGSPVAKSDALVGHHAATGLIIAALITAGAFAIILSDHNHSHPFTPPVSP